MSVQPIQYLHETIAALNKTVTTLNDSLSGMEKQILQLEAKVAADDSKAPDEVEVADAEVVETMTNYGLYDFLSDVNTADSYIIVNDMILKTYSDGSMRFYANLQIRSDANITSTDSVDTILFDGITSTKKIELKKIWQATTTSTGSATIVYLDSSGIHFSNAGREFLPTQEITVACYLDETAASTVTISSDYTATETSDALSDPISANLTYDLTLQSTVNSNSSQMGFTKLNLTMRNYDKGWLKLDYAGVFVDPNGATAGDLRVVITSSVISSTAIIEPSPASSTYENWMFFIYPTRGLVASNPDNDVAMGTEISGSLILLAPYGATFTLDTTNIASNGLAAKTLVLSFEEDNCFKGRLSLSNTENGVNVKLEAGMLTNGASVSEVERAIAAVCPDQAHLPITIIRNDLMAGDQEQRFLIYSDQNVKMWITLQNDGCSLQLEAGEVLYENTYYCFSGEIPNAFVNLSALMKNQQVAQRLIKA